MNKKRIAGILVALATLAAPLARCEDSGAMMERANKFFDGKHYEQALALFLKAAELDADKEGGHAPDALLMASVQYYWLAQEKQDAAYVEKETATLRKLIAKYPASRRAADAYLYLGQNLRDCKAAIGLYEKAIETADRNWIKAQAKGRIGQCLQSMGRDAEAQVVYKEVVEKYPDTPLAEELKRTVPGVPGYKGPPSGDNVESWMAQADKFFDDKQYERALALYLKVAERAADKDSGYAANALLMAGVQYDWLVKEKKDAAYVEKEKATLRKLIEKYPTSSRVADAYLYLGQIYSGHVRVKVQTDCKTAIGLFEKAIETADRDWIKAQAKGRIGQCLEQSGRKAEARAAYQEVLAKYPDTPWAGEVKKLLGK